MPNGIFHRMRSAVKFGEEGRDIHDWIDKPVKWLGQSHRMERHCYDQILPKRLTDLYDHPERAYAHMIQHLDDDFIPEIRGQGCGYIPLIFETIMDIRMDHLLWELDECSDRVWEIICLPFTGIYYSKDIELVNYKFLRQVDGLRSYL